MLKQKEEELQSIPEILDPNPEAPNIIKEDDKKTNVKKDEEPIIEKPLERETEKENEIELPEMKKEDK